MTRTPSSNGGQAPDPAGDLRARLRSDLREAMKARDAVATGLLRRLIALIDNAEAVALSPDQSRSVGLAAGASEWLATGGAFGGAEVPRKTLSADDLATLFQGEADRLAASDAEMRRVGRPDAADKARVEAELLTRLVDCLLVRSPS